MTPEAWAVVMGVVGAVTAAAGFAAGVLWASAHRRAAEWEREAAEIDRRNAELRERTGRGCRQTDGRVE